MKALSLIRSLDFLGNSVNFSINSKDKFPTFLGGVISFVLYFLYFYLFYIFAKDLYFKKDPSGYNRIKPYIEGDDIPELEIKNNSFFAGIQIYDELSQVIETDELFFPLFTHHTFIYNKTKKEFEDYPINLPSIPCNDELLDKRINRSYFNLSTFHCPDFSELKNKSISGNFNYPETKIITARFSICNFNNTICKNATKIKNEFNNRKIFSNTIYPEILYNIDDYNNPFTVRLANNYRNLNFNSQISEELHLIKNQVETDSGIMFESNSIMERIGKKELRSDIRFFIEEITNENKYEFNEYDIFHYGFLIYFNMDVTYYFRNYIKIQDAIANVFGILDLIIIFLSYFYSPFNQFKINSHICRKLLFIENEFEDFFVINNNNKLTFNGNGDQNEPGKIKVKKDKMNVKIFKKKLLQILEKEKDKENDNNNNVTNKNVNDGLKNFTIDNIINNIEVREENIIPENAASLKNELSNINNQNSHRRFVSNNFSANDNDNKNKLIQKNEIKSYAEFLTKKFYQNKNSLTLSYLMYMKYLIFPRKKNQKNYKILEKFSEKLFNKFDVFHYLNKQKEFKILKEILLTNSSKDFIKIVSGKSYKIDASEIENENENSNQNDNDNEKNGNKILINNAIESLFGGKLDDKEEKLIMMLLN